MVFQLLEKEVVLKVREQDQELINGLVPSITRKYKEISGLDINLKVDNESYLPADISGGIELVALKGRIKVSNTLESRLELIAQQLVPQVMN